MLLNGLVNRTLTLEQFNRSMIPRNTAIPLFSLTSHQQIGGEYDVEGRHAHHSHTRQDWAEDEEGEEEEEAPLSPVPSNIYSFAFGWSSCSSTFANW